MEEEVKTSLILDQHNPDTKTWHKKTERKLHIPHEDRHKNSY